VSPIATTAREVALQVLRDVFGPTPRGARESRTRPRRSRAPSTLPAVRRALPPDDFNADVDQCLTNLGDLYESSGDFDKARSYDTEALKALEEENRELKKLLAESVLDVATLKEALGKNF